MWILIAIIFLFFATAKNAPLKRKRYFGLESCPEMFPTIEDWEQHILRNGGDPSEEIKKWTRP